jgi:hypothetical protein
MQCLDPAFWDPAGFVVGGARNGSAIDVPGKCDPGVFAYVRGGAMHDLCGEYDHRAGRHVWKHWGRHEPLLVLAAKIKSWVDERKAPGERVGLISIAGGN